MSKHNVSLKLLIDTKRQSVLFAEASENLTDLLSDMLSQPVGAVVSLLRQQEMAAGSLANLCKSMENMKLNLTPAAKGLYVCNQLCDKYNYYGSSRIKYSDDARTVCPTCCKPMDKQLEYVAPPKAPSREGGVAASYLITDDLQVMPLSTISIMTQLNKFGVKDVSALQEKVVHLGLDEAVKLLNASLQSKKALTDVFLTAKPKAKGVKRERLGDLVNLA